MLLFLLLVVTFVYYYVKRKYSFWRDKNVVGPKPILFFGNLKETILRRKNLGYLYKEIYDEFPKEKVVGIYRMMNPTLIIRDLDIIKQILVKDFDVFSDRGIFFAGTGLGDNLFHCDGDTWRALHSHFTPLFTSGKLKNSTHLLDRHANQMVDALEAMILKNSEQELFQHFRKYCIATIMNFAFNINFDFFNEDNNAVEKAAQLIIRSTYYNEIDMLFSNILKKLNMSLYPNLTQKFCYDLIRILNDKRKGVSTASNDVLDVFLNLKERHNDTVKENQTQTKFEVTEHLMAAQVFVFLAAGFSNNTLSMSYALFRLARDREIQNKLLQEIDVILNKYDNQLTYEAINEMTYLDKVFSEVLRLNSLAVAVTRSSKTDYKIPGTDLMINEGTAIIISPYAIHRDENIYPNADKFHPERFAPENCAGRHPCAYIPFGAGPRSCMGKRMAKLQFCFGIVRILQKFRVEPSEKTKILEDYDPMSTLLATSGGVYVKFIPRNKSL